MLIFFYTVNHDATMRMTYSSAKIKLIIFITDLFSDGWFTTTDTFIATIYFYIVNIQKIWIQKSNFEIFSLTNLKVSFYQQDLPETRYECKDRRIIEEV